jgi:prepilin-type N-terminal cleavage/methylation domain-containing protein
MKRSRGLTLVELVVVLAILVLLAGVAVTSLQGTVDQRKFDVTAEILRDVEKSVLGDPDLRNTDGTPLLVGFVADMGRLPHVPDDGDATAGESVASEIALAELWNANAGSPAMPAFALGTPAGDGEVKIGAGWRGPYLRLPAGTSELFTGWGKAFRSLSDDAPFDPAENEGDSIRLVRSLGADDAAGGASPFDGDADATFEGTAGVYWKASLQALVDSSTPLSGTEYVVVRVYGPASGAPATVAQWASGGTLPGGTPPPGTAFPELVLLADVALGTKAVRAYVLDTGAYPAVPALEDDLTSVPASKKSDVRYVVQIRGGLPTPVSLEID